MLRRVFCCHTGGEVLVGRWSWCWAREPLVSHAPPRGRAQRAHQHRALPLPGVPCAQMFPAFSDWMCSRSLFDRSLERRPQVDADVDAPN